MKRMNEEKEFVRRIPPLKSLSRFGGRARGMLILLLSFSFTYAEPAEACLLSFSSTVRVRLFTEKDPPHVFFKVTSGNYRLICRGIKTSDLNKGDEIIISRYKDFIAVKVSGLPAFSADSVDLENSTEDSRFSLSTGKLSGNYSGRMTCYPDLSGIVIVNTCDIEDYIAGVVMAEGGRGKNIEFFKTQAVIARTYTYKYSEKHVSDRFNLCDDTHCQAFSGITTDPVIARAVDETKDMVIIAPDSTLIISAFHSNCGGETSPSEFVWLSPQPYLIKVADPFCITSRNALWEMTISLKSWIAVLKKNNYSGPPDNSSLFAFSQPVRSADYKIEGFTMPLRTIRDELGLKSTWFSVIPQDDSLYIRGKGYGHGVGLCQEGAMVMASEGSGFEEIIRFYYPGVKVIGIRFAKKDMPDGK